MGYAALGALFMFLVIFAVVWYVTEICSLLGIVFGCISSSNSKKYVNTRGLGNYKSIKNYHTAATVFMVISCVVVGIWVTFWIFAYILSDQSADFDTNLSTALAEFFASSITTMAIHIGSIIAGIVAQVQYKKAKELNADILSGKVVPPPPPVVMMPVYPVNPYQQNGYYQNGYNGQGQPNGGYPQNGYYNQPNPYGQNPQQNPYNPNPQQAPYSQNPQGYQAPPSSPYNGQGYQAPPSNSASANGQPDPQSQFPDPTVTAAAAVSTPAAEGEKTVTCPNCGSVNAGNSKFCTNCGQIMK